MEMLRNCKVDFMLLLTLTYIGDITKRTFNAYLIHSMHWSFLINTRFRPYSW